MVWISRIQFLLRRNAGAHTVQRGLFGKEPDYGAVQSLHRQSGKAPQLHRYLWQFQGLPPSHDFYNLTMLPYKSPLSGNPTVCYDSKNAFKSQDMNICIPFMEKGAKILNISSASAFQPVPYINLYAATKAFERSYSRSLNTELKSYGITVTAVCPGWVDTDMLSKEINGKRVRFPGIVAPEKVVKKAIKDAKKGRDMSICSFYVKCQHLNVKLLPQRLTMKIWLHGIKDYL